VGRMGEGNVKNSIPNLCLEFFGGTQKQSGFRRSFTKEVTLVMGGKISVNGKKDLDGGPQVIESKGRQERQEKSFKKGGQ